MGGNNHRRLEALEAIVGRAGVKADSDLVGRPTVELAFIAITGGVPAELPAYQQAVADGVETLTDEQWQLLVDMLRERC